MFSGKLERWSWNFPEIASLMLDSYRLAEILLSGRLAQLTFFLGKGAALTALRVGIQCWTGGG